jgi:hypothetical protein
MIRTLLARWLIHEGYEVVGRPPSPERAFIWNDCDQVFESDIARITADINGTHIREAVQDVLWQVQAGSTL